MKKHLKILAIAALAFVRCGHKDVHNSGNPFEGHWSYVGNTGPTKWADLKPEFSVCRDGKQQSPIDIVDYNDEKLTPLIFSYKPSDFTVVNNGYTIQVNFAPGNTVKIRGEVYELTQMHFHTTSEHTINRKTYPMEIHFVHKNSTGKLAQVGVWMELGKGNNNLDLVWAKIPKEKHLELAGTKINPQDFLPRDKKYFHYTGSETIPPCTEGVNWNIMKSPVKLSAKQYEMFRKFYSVNNRPTQPAFARVPASSL